MPGCQLHQLSTLRCCTQLRRPDASVIQKALHLVSGITSVSCKSHRLLLLLRRRRSSSSNALLAQNPEAACNPQAMGTGDRLNLIRGEARHI